MAKAQRVEIVSDGIVCQRLAIGGYDIRNDTTAAVLTLGSARLPELTLDLIVGVVDAAVAARVELSPATRAALVAMGWTAPTEETR